LARAVPLQLQGVSKQRIKDTLALVDCNTADMIDAVFALLDDTTPSAFGGAPPGAKFCDGASTAHIAVHVGRFQRGGTKLDREGRDYWIKPLRKIVAVEAVYLDPDGGRFVDGHAVAKSPNSAYRLASSFVDVLKASPSTWRPRVRDWISAERQRERLALQAEAVIRARAVVATGHHDLIEVCKTVYAPRFLKGYEVVYVDDGDGDRITDAQREDLARAGIVLSLADSMPDILLWNPDSDALWVIEAVTSDGEVDLYKFEQLTTLAGRCQKRGIGFTTAYPSWSVVKARQAAHKNIAPDTYVWVEEDPSKHFLAVDDQQELFLVPSKRSRRR